MIPVNNPLDFRIVRGEAWSYGVVTSLSNDVEDDLTLETIDLVLYYGPKKDDISVTITSGGPLHLATTGILPAHRSGAATITSAFLADGAVVVAGADFVAAGVVANDMAIIEGSTSNDRLARVISVTTTTLTLATVFNVEPQLGTVRVVRPGTFVPQATAAETAVLNLSNCITYAILISATQERLLGGDARVSDEVLDG